MKWTVGQALSPLAKPAITREQLHEYAEASGDKNPIHLDDTFAKEAGFPSVIVHGMLSMAFIADHVAKNFPEAEYDVKRLKTRFRKVTFPGDVLTCEGKVKLVTPEGRVVVSLSLTNQKAELTADGEAEIAPH